MSIITRYSLLCITSAERTRKFREKLKAKQENKPNVLAQAKKINAAEIKAYKLKVTQKKQ